MTDLPTTVEVCGQRLEFNSVDVIKTDAGEELWGAFEQANRRLSLASQAPDGRLKTFWHETAHAWLEYLPALKHLFAEGVEEETICETLGTLISQHEMANADLLKVLLRRKGK